MFSTGASACFVTLIVRHAGFAHVGTKRYYSVCKAILAHSQSSSSLLTMSADASPDKANIMSLRARLDALVPEKGQSPKGCKSASKRKTNASASTTTTPHTTTNKSNIDKSPSQDFDEEKDNDGVPVSASSSDQIGYPKCCLGCKRTVGVELPFLITGAAFEWLYADQRGLWCRDCAAVYRVCLKTLITLPMLENWLSDQANRISFTKNHVLLELEERRPFAHPRVSCREEGGVVGLRISFAWHALALSYDQESERVSRWRG